MSMFAFASRALPKITSKVHLSDLPPELMCRLEKASEAAFRKRSTVIDVSELAADGGDSRKYDGYDRVFVFDAGRCVEIFWRENDRFFYLKITPFGQYSEPIALALGFSRSLVKIPGMGSAENDDRSLKDVLPSGPYLARKM
jgi:hypothetical protein